MTGKKLQRLLACLLAVLLLSQVGAFSPAVFAADASGYTLQDGTAIIPAGTSKEDVDRILAAALVVGFDQMSGEEQDRILTGEWQYACEGKSAISTKNTAWGPVTGFDSSKKFGLVTTKYSHPALSANEDASYPIRLKLADGTLTNEVKVYKAQKPVSSITLKEGVTVTLPYNADVSINFDALRERIFDQVVESTTPDLKVNDVTIEYYATATTGAAVGFGKNWAPLEGGKVDGLNYPAISAGDQQIQISFKGDDTYKASSETTTVTFTERPGIEAATKENPTFKLDFTADGEAIYDNIRQQVWDAVVVSTKPALTVDNVTIEYYATATTGAVDKLGHAWVALTGGKVNGLTYPAIGEGTQEVRITWGGSKNYAAWQWQGNVAVTGRADAPFRFKEGVTEGMTVAMVYNRDQSINYEETAQALREALLESTDSNISIDDVTVQYNADITGITKNYKPLDCNETLVLVKFGLGNQIIHFSWSGNADYKPLKLDDVTVKMSDNRIKSRIVLKDGVSITYHMDPAVMEQEIFENLIDWDASTLPEKSTLSAADFTFEYYGENVLGEEDGGISGGVPDWAPVAGGTVNFLNYPQMGAGENQKVRVSYSGNDEYCPCKNVEGTLTVNKAKVSVKVHSTSIYADEELSKDFITTDPVDNFDIFTVFGGVTSASLNLKNMFIEPTSSMYLFSLPSSQSTCS